MELVQLEKLMSAVEPKVKQAGEILLSYFHKVDLVKRQKGYGDLVTEADVASEAFLIEQLGALFPEASFFAEESGVTQPHDYCWVIDPLDGTTNFAYGIDYFCVSVALTYKNRPILGCVYRPSADEMFSAIRGGGSYLNGQKITVSTVKTVDRAFISVCLPYGRNEQFTHAVSVFERLADASYAIRKLGAAALDQAYVACGRLDASIFEKLGWWDVAAGMLLVQESGGYVATYQNEVVGPEYRSYIATNGQLYPEFEHLISKKMGE